jgi:CHAD domain-containing protein
MVRRTKRQLATEPGRGSVARNGGNSSEARIIALDPNMTTAEAFISIGIECLCHIVRNRQSVLRGESEGIHQMRVGLRRLRAALSIFKKMLRKRDIIAITDKVKWLAGQLAPAREYHVFLTGAFEDAHTSGIEFEVVKADIRARRDLLLNSAKRVVGSDDFRAFIVELALWLLDGSWLHNRDSRTTFAREKPLERFAQHEMQKCVRKISNAARRVDKLTPARRHKLRIAAKKTRYTYGFFEYLITTKAIKGIKHGFVEELKSFQDKLGKLNDIATQLELASRLSRELKDDKEAFALGFVIGLRTGRIQPILKKAKRSGRRLYKLA